MADVRALLRQQRAARRIEHPHAAYSDAGKLLCTVCREHVKTESLWDGHLRSTGHRQRLQSLHKASSNNGTNGYAGFVGEDLDRNGNLAPSNKRKLVDADEETDGHAGEDTVRRKRSRAELEATDQGQEGTSKKDDRGKASKPLTPPLTRRTSGTPSMGVEMQIPSRPATPGPSGTPMATTPKVPVGRPSLISDEPQQQRKDSTSLASADAQLQPADQMSAAAPVNEDEWAAFEAELIHGTAGKSSTKPAAAAALDSGAVISAPVMSAAEIAAKSEEEESAKRRALVDIQIEDEKEEATRALETEFEVMEELEARARKLRERREALRLQGGGGVAVPSIGTTEGAGKGVSPGKENAAVLEDDDEDENEDEEEDDWDGFRFRA
ncbi:hypothetical protein MMYC01_200472 [Madurella mycetomatis]|uniref:Uncharacterized protein n=1 Tax=Madurella mycetomatis TaxID=100816 RepID=A0A175WH64_9PEZI|nr:hypothetical protein MMYC01_200472 [Madurella mycetomatis]